MAHIFFVGATGHIGGEVLHEIVAARPDIIITALVRDKTKGERLAESFPNLTPLVADIKNSPEIVEKAARDAGIVINTAPDAGSEEGIAAILRGLAKYPTKGYYIHTSGAGLIWDDAKGAFAGEKVWDDVEDIDEITSMPNSTEHRVQDEMVFGASSATNVAIISPTVVAGLSDSIDAPIPLTIPFYIQTVRAVGSAFTITKGANVNGYIHVKDLAQIYLSLLLDALEGAASDPTLWGPQSYYFGTAEEFSILEFMQALAPILKKAGLVESDEVKHVSVEDTAGVLSGETGKTIPPWSLQAAEKFGTNMRCRSSRAAKLLGWAPKEKGVKEGLAEVVEAFLSREKK